MDSATSCSEARPEVALLMAMYPDQLTWNEHNQEIKYVAVDRGMIVLRLPDDYPGSEQPIVISAQDSHKSDLREGFRRVLDQLNISALEENCDTIIQAFEDFCTTVDKYATADNTKIANQHTQPQPRGYKTTIIWLHHLLATSKRKLALHPSREPGSLSGITKPGYPGILMYSGPTHLVDSHVTELKDQRWQAFQVRFEEEYEREAGAFKFVHGEGIIELESMSHIVQDIIDKDQQQQFLHASGIK